MNCRSKKVPLGNRKLMQEQNVSIGELEADLTTLEGHGKTVAVVGDGINAAPALAQADVCIAIGGGTGIAKETGGTELSKKTIRKIYTNLLWAFGYSVALSPVAALGLLNHVYAVWCNGDKQPNRSQQLGAIEVG